MYYTFWYTPLKYRSGTHPMQEGNVKRAKRSDERKGSTRKNIRFEDTLIDQIEADRQKSEESFSEWVKDACQRKLKH